MRVLPFTLFDFAFAKCLTGAVGLLTDCLTDSSTGLHITSMSDEVVFVASSISSPGKKDVSRKKHSETSFLTVFWPSKKSLDLPEV